MTYDGGPGQNRTADTLIFSLFGRFVQECLLVYINVQFQLLDWHRRFHRGLLMSINTRGWGYNGATPHTGVRAAKLDG